MATNKYYESFRSASIASYQDRRTNDAETKTTEKKEAITYNIRTNHYTWLFIRHPHGQLFPDAAHFY